MFSVSTRVVLIGIIAITKNPAFAAKNAPNPPSDGKGARGGVEYPCKARRRADDRTLKLAVDELVILGGDRACGDHLEGAAAVDTDYLTCGHTRALYKICAEGSYNFARRVEIETCRSVPELTDAEHLRDLRGSGNNRVELIRIEEIPEVDKVGVGELA